MGLAMSLSQITSPIASVRLGVQITLRLVQASFRLSPETEPLALVETAVRPPAPNFLIRPVFGETFLVIY